MIQSLTLTPRGDSLGLVPVWSGSPLVLRGPVLADHVNGGYRAHLWRSRLDARVPGAVPLATAYGSVASGYVTWAFTGEQMRLELRASGGEFDDFWLQLIALQADGQEATIRAGWLTVLDGGADPQTSVPALTVFKVTNDKALFEVEGVTYFFQVEAIEDVPGTPNGSLEVVEDNFRFVYNGVRYRVLCEGTSTPPGSDEGEVQVIADKVIITLSGQSYTWPCAVL